MDLPLTSAAPGVNGLAAAGFAGVMSREFFVCLSQAICQISQGAIRKRSCHGRPRK